MTYIIYALPRSRTYWLSKFLSYQDWHCGHDELRHARTLDDVQSWLSMENTGTIETAGAPYWRLVKHLKTVVIRRPIGEVMMSLAKFNVFDPDRLFRQLQQLDRKLDQIEARVENVISIPYHRLSDELACKTIFEHCLPYQHDPEWWHTLNEVNLQIDMQQMIRYYRAHEVQLNKLAKIAKHKMISGMIHESVDQDDGLTIQEETFEQSFDDCKRLFAQHSIEVGEAPDSFAEKNLPLIQKLEEHGFVQITTARCNGRMFGYLMAVMSPSLESPDINTAIHTTFFASPLFKGLGMKLQRASVNFLRQKGINELYLHAGIRGAGPRLGTVYRRLGAADFGQMYKLNLNTSLT